MLIALKDGEGARAASRVTVLDYTLNTSTCLSHCLWSCGGLTARQQTYSPRGENKAGHC